MEKESNHDHICLCPLEGIINIIGKKWAILVISIIGHHDRIRFNDIMQHLDGISPKTLTDVLKDLGKENLIHRESFAEIPPRVEYSLTDDGRQLCEAVIPLIAWAEMRDSADKHRCRASCHGEKIAQKQRTRQKKQ
ncbi:helix-turn-helix domain-containing protein [uncultured Methanoregula sp.]|uniref:winged helix-turn-helix transcriptional regulator n=1 Tax=uncultured Methanoregula sp. TaxID=1005933 RepID=UPI002AAB4CE2|nr:helix-turn-helix domain-containing protein [uncultured Methanoregula sp.]